jgi:phosphopantetheinyl transferase (holo-ACP synthase)
LFLTGAEIDLSPLFGHRIDGAGAIAGVAGCDLPPAETEKLQNLASFVYAEQPANALAMIHQHFTLMNEFLAVQASVTQRTLAALRPTPALEARRGTSLPLLGSAMREKDGVFVWQTRLDTHNLPFLRDHVLGRIPSPRNSHLHALAVVPFTFSLEMLAEAAARIDGGVAVAMGGIRALRWLALDQGFLTLEVEARRVPGERSIKVQIFELAQGGKERLKAFEGIVQMADRYERSPAAEALALEQPTSLRWSANDFYEYCLFHGKSLRSISEVVGLGELGIEAKLVAPDAETLFRDGQTGLQLSANLLDVMGQLVGYWLVERGAEFFGVFPVGGDTAQFFRGPVVRGERLTCRAKIARCGGYLEADFQFVDEKGDLACRVQGMRFGYYELPEKYLYAIYWPGTQTYLSQPWMEGQTDVLCRRLELASCAFFEDAAAIWKRALAHMTLTRTERDLWYSFGESGERRLDWLLGRIAAKECIRAFAARLGLELACADIEILPDERGKPVVRCAVWNLEGEIPQVSISHKDGVAMAALATHGGLIGLDLERLPRSGQHSLDLAFGDEEKALLAATAGGGDKLALGCWCAKEAVAKAFGTGLKGTPDRWKVVSISEDARDLEVEHEGIVAGVRLFMNGNEVVAICNGTDPERVKHAESR